MGLFVYFIHHVATNIQLSSIISSIATETRDAIRKVFPQEATEDASDCEFTPEEERLLARMKWHAVPALETGYLQTVDRTALAAFAVEHQAVVRMECDVGNFVLENSPLVSLGSGGTPDPKMVQQLNRLFTLAPYCTIDQDPAFGVRQIMDIAVKALSPGINNPATAINSLAAKGKGQRAKGKGQRAKGKGQRAKGWERIVKSGALAEASEDSHTSADDEYRIGSPRTLLRGSATDGQYRAFSMPSTV